MNYSLLLCFLLFCGIEAQGQTKSQQKQVLISSKKGGVEVSINENGELAINVPPKDIAKYKAKGFVQYSDFGALGDGKTDDINAIAATHAFANSQNLSVKANVGANYYIGGNKRTAIVKTNTDFGTASFIIDDTKVQNRLASIFEVSSDIESFELSGIHILKKNQEKLDVTLPGTCLIRVTDSMMKRYIRLGLNQDTGSSQTDLFVVDKNGQVDMDAPIIWDFDSITEIIALPIDETTLNISGGRFTTIANNADSKYEYYARNINIKRSNVVVDGLEHRVISEGDHGAPYRGFISMNTCTDVIVKNTILTGRKVYSTIGSAGKPVRMGTYDITVEKALNVSFINCCQTNDINDKKYWGIMGSNNSKNIIYDNCKLSRFDAHKGVVNATIRNSTIGHMGINALGSGLLTIENTTVHCRNFMVLRRDYGSTWQGNLMIRNCVFAPNEITPSGINIIGGFNSGQHDFGYSCYMPNQIIIEDLHIKDSDHSDSYKGPTVFEDFNPQMTNQTYQELFPYIKTKYVLLKNIIIDSKMPLRKSDNRFMFKDVQVKSD